MAEPLEPSSPVTQQAEGDHIVQAVSSVVTVVGGHPVSALVAPVRLVTGPRVSPARLLRAASSVVGFVDRGGILNDLLSWATDGERLAVHVVAGGGGTGKTRLAVELCHALADAPPAELSGGWRVGFLSDEASPDSLLGLAYEPVPRLIVVDYAETRREQVGSLLTNLAASGASAPVRVVLLVRQAGSAGGDGSDPAAQWVSAVRPYGNDVANQLLDQADVVVLNDEPLTVAERQDLFNRAGLAYRNPESREYENPVDLATPLYEQPLMVVSAGYLAARGGERVPSTAAGMFEAILEHEARYWQPTAKKAKLKLTGQELAELVAVATLTGVADQCEADAVLRLLPSHHKARLRDLRRASDWLSTLHGDAGGQRWLPLEPDRLGEYLVASRLSGLPEILDWSLQATRDDEQLVRPLTVLARAAASYPALRQAAAAVISTHIEPLVQAAVTQARDPRRYTPRWSRLPDTLADAIAVFGPDINPDDLGMASNLLPDQNHILASLAVSVSSALVDIFRTLADPTTGNPAAYQPDLATALDDLGIWLSDLGRRAEALPPAQEAVAIYRALADPITGNPAAHRPDLAGALNNLGNRLSEWGRREEALPPTQEAVDIYRALADPTTGKPTAYQPGLATALNNLGIRLSDLGRIEDALPPIQEAVDIRRALADPKTGNPAAYQPDLATALANLGVLLSDLGRREEALPPTQEAVDIQRALADPITGNPAAYQPDLATALTNLGARLSDLGRREEALPPTQEAVDIRRALADPITGNPAAYQPDLATALTNLGARLSDLGRREEALPPTQEAVDIRRALADPTTGNPAAYQPGLASALNNLGALLSELDLPEEALPPTQEAVDTYRALANPITGNPDAYRPYLAMALTNFGILLTQLGLPEEALPPTQEAVDTYRALANPTTGNPDAYRPYLATALSNFGILLSHLGLQEEALTPTQEAVDIRRALADPTTGNPTAFRPGLANSLWAIGWICANGHFGIDRGLSAVNESIELFEQLVRATGTVHLADLEAASGTRMQLLRLEDASVGG